MAPHMRPMVPPWAPKGYIGDHSEPPWSKSRGPMAPHMGAPWTPQGHIEVDDVGLGMSSQPTPLTHFMATQLFKDPQRGPGSIYINSRSTAMGRLLTLSMKRVDLSKRVYICCNNGNMPR